MRWFGATWTFWSASHHLPNRAIEQHLEVKCWYQCRSKVVGSSCECVIACPYCYRTFRNNRLGLGSTHARTCPKTYPWRLRHFGRLSIREAWFHKYSIRLLTATTKELSDKDIIRL